MKRAVSALLSFIIIFLLMVSTSGNTDAAAEEFAYKIKMQVRSADPVYCPRPYKNAKNIPLNTSFYARLYIDNASSGETIDLNSIQVQLGHAGSEPIYILNNNQKFADGYFGSITREDGGIVAVYIDSNKKLKPSTKYDVRISASTNKGSRLAVREGSWSFRTGPEEKVYEVKRTVDFSSSHVNWHGRHFSGLTRAYGSYDPPKVIRMDYIFSDEIKEKYPNAWKLFRYEISQQDILSDSIINGYLANFVREKETRRVISVEEKTDGILLKVEDFFGHQQYGIESNRPLSGDYKAGDIILIGDKDNSRTATVISVNDAENTVLVSKFDQPAGGWKIEYFSPPPTEENPYAPGLFSRGGTYLYKFSPSGTPVYYWDRLDTILDMYVLKYGQRMSINIIDAYRELSVDGQNANYPKDYVQFHQVTYDVVSHLIERYGDRTATWVWSIFNEPDLSTLYWRSGDWIELQRFYDYAVDAILKAFEDKGYNSDRIIIGGLELGAVFGTYLTCHDFLAHCSPTAKRDNILNYNAAYADPRLDGKRSKRVEKLCAANNGKGTPLDFISIHTYNSSEIAAAKLITAKEIALEIDPVYYDKLWIYSFESVPDWAHFDDPGLSEWTLGNGYFPSWTADYFSRLLKKACEDPRFSYGESVFTIWGWPQNMFEPFNDVVFQVAVRDGRIIRDEILPKPIFHYLNLFSTMDTNYWYIEDEMIGGHNVAGFAATGDGDLRMVLYSHNVNDPQSRSDASFNFKMELKGIKWNKVKVTEYRMDKINNTYYPFALEKRSKTALSEREFSTLKELTELKVSSERIYKVNNGGSVNLVLPVAANGLNFIVLSNADDAETPPEETPTQPETRNPDDGEELTDNEPPSGEPTEPDKTSGNETPDETKKPVGSPDTGDDGILTAVLLVFISGIIAGLISKRYIH